MKKNIANIISFTSLFFAWISIVLLFQGEPYKAIFINCISVTLDIFDGIAARKFGSSNEFGRNLDSAIDIINYLIFSVILMSLFILTNQVSIILAGFFVLAFGIARLTKLNIDGIQKDGDASYYTGVTTVHISFLIITLFFITQIFTIPDIILLMLVSIPAFLMVSKVKVYKKRMYPIMIAFLILFMSLSIYFELSN